MQTGAIIRQLRKEHRISQVELAKSVHVSQATVTAWETGKAEPSSSALNSLSEYFNVSADYLLGRDSPSSIPSNVDLDKAIDGAMSFEGQPVTEHDREVMKSLWKAYLASKE